MLTILIVGVLGLVLLAIVALPKMFRGKDDAPLPHLPEQAPMVPRSPKPAAAPGIDSSPLARWLCDEACTQTGIDLLGDPLALPRIADAAKKRRRISINLARRRSRCPISAPMPAAPNIPICASRASRSAR